MGRAEVNRGQAQTTFHNLPYVIQWYAQHAYAAYRIFDISHVTHTHVVCAHHDVSCRSSTWQQCHSRRCMQLCSAGTPQRARACSSPSSFAPPSGPCAATTPAAHEKSM